MMCRPRSASALAILLGVVCVAGCESLGELMEAAGVGQPTASVRNVALSALSLDQATLDFEVEVSNPTGVPLPIAGVDYGLSSGGRSFVSGSSEFDEMIPAGGSRVIRIPANVLFSSLVQTLQGVRPGSTVPYTANLGISVGAPGAGRLKLPLEQSGEIPVPAAPRVTLDRIMIQKFTLQEGAALLTLTVANPNTFRLDLSALDYGLKLAGQDVARANIARPMSFEPGATGVVEIPITVNPMIVGPAVRNAFLGGDRSGYDLSGTMEFGTPFGAINAPFSAQGSVPLTR